MLEKPLLRIGAGGIPYHILIIHSSGGSRYERQFGDASARAGNGQPQGDEVDMDFTALPFQLRVGDPGKDGVHLGEQFLAGVNGHGLFSEEFERNGDLCLFIPTTSDGTCNLGDRLGAGSYISTQANTRLWLREALDSPGFRQEQAK